MEEETLEDDVAKANRGDNGCAEDSLSLSKSSRFGGPVTCVAFAPSVERSNESEEPSSFSPGCSSSSSSPVFFVAQGPYLARYESSRDSYDDVEARLLVFPPDDQRPRGGGTIHGIRFRDPNTTTKGSSISWDAIVYGAKRLAVCRLLGSEGMNRLSLRVGEEGGTTIASSDPARSVRSSPFVELDDWIWNVQMIPRELGGGGINSHGKGVRADDTTTMVIGYARHMIEVWDAKVSSPKDTVCWTRLRRLFLSPPTVVTSMDFVWGRETPGAAANTSNNPAECIWIAAGTSFHKIWISCLPVHELFSDDKAGEETIGAVPRNNHCLLRGHLGVVHSVRWFREGDQIALASTSDDRTVRKWVWDTSQNQWTERWVGWGHSARVWSVSMVCSSLDVPHCSSAIRLVSVAEDGTARIWSSESGDLLACIHHSSTLRTVDARNTTDGGTFVTGGTDGVSATYNICNHVAGETMLTMDEIAVPDDRPPATEAQNSNMTAEHKTEGIKEGDVPPTKKKKKKKTQSQVLVGVKCWRDGSKSGTPRIIVATRQGSLMSLDFQERKWTTHDTWCGPSTTEIFGIQPSDGNCIAIRNGISVVAIGTSRGDIVLTSLHQEKKDPAVILNARTFRSVQGLAFLDSSCLVSFHVHSVVLWKVEFVPFPSATIIEPTYVLELKTKGIPQSCAYDQVNQRIIVGDSRGNLAYFQINIGRDQFQSEEQNQVIPTCVVPKVHQKQHITSITWLNQNTILSAGNDGCVHLSYLHGDSLIKGWSYPAPSLTGITRIINNSSPTIVAGYHGNTYRVLDIDSGYEYIRCETGGRQRILDCSFNVERSCEATPRDYQLVVCKAQKDGSNHLFIQYSNQHTVLGAFKGQNRITKGVKLHGETIFDSTFFTLKSAKVLFLVTASEDCSSRITAWAGGRVVDSILLTPQESCCRCVVASQIDEKSALLVVGGGKLTLQFFLIKERCNCTEINSVRDLEIIFLGNGLTSKKGATIDHRFNAVAAVPFRSSKIRSHFVIAGDSEGNSHAFLIPEDNHQNYKNRFGVLVPMTNERPILCIKTLVIGSRILILMGTTRGNIDLFDLPASPSRLRDCWDDFSNLWNPIGTYHAHQIGTNTISVDVLSLEEADGKIRAVVSIVSGGDDQALCISRVNMVENFNNCHNGLQLERIPELQAIKEASFSAIKGVMHARFGGQRYILSVGYSQQLSLWRFDVNDEVLLQSASRLPVDLGDINCLSAFQSPDELGVVVAVCGMGVEIFETNITS